MGESAQEQGRLATEGCTESANRQGDGLPEGWVWTRIGEICEVNPTMSYPEKLTDESSVSFVPMAAVDEFEGAITSPETRPIEEVWKGYTRFSEGDVIFAKITPCMENGKAAIARNLVNGIGLGSTEFHVLRASEVVSAEWIYYFVRQESFRGDAMAEMTGTAGQLRVPTRFMDKARIPLAPFPEQHRIVEAIETQFTRLDAAVAALERARANLKRYRASVLQAACEGRLVPTEAELTREQGRDYEPADALLARILDERRARWEEERWEYEIERAKKKAAQAERKAAGLPYYIRDLPEDSWIDRPPEEYEPYLPKSDKWKQKYDEPQPPDTEGLPALSDGLRSSKGGVEGPELPEGWVWASVEQVITLSQNGFGKRHSDEGYPTIVLRLADIEGGRRLSLENIRRIRMDSEEINKYRLLEDDLLCIRVNGSPDLVGRIIPFEDSNEPVAFCDHFIRLRFAKPEVTSFFVQYSNTRRARRYIDLNKVSSAGQNTISQTTIESLVFPLPPLAEQHRIVEEVERRLSVVEALEQAVETNLTRAQRLRQAILKKAFEGRLVPQNPDDEPASALLARIHTEHRRGDPRGCPDGTGADGAGNDGADTRPAPTEEC